MKTRSLMFYKQIVGVVPKSVNLIISYKLSRPPLSAVPHCLVQFYRAMELSQIYIIVFQTFILPIKTEKS